MLDCLVLHLIIVDEDKAKAISESTLKSQQLHDQMNKLRKKGKLKAYKEIKQEMLAEGINNIVYVTGLAGASAAVLGAIGTWLLY